MGVNGPIPNRSDQRVRRNKPDTPIETITTIGPVEIPDLNMPNAHPLVQELYEAMKNSAQKQFFEPSDWAYAKIALHYVNKSLNQENPSAMLLASVNTMLTSLLLTEGDRRRVRIEVERSQEGAKVLDIAEMFRKKLEQG